MECIFCKIAKKEIESKTIYEDEAVIAIMDINPVVDGHVLIIPKKHYTDYKELDEEIKRHMDKIADKLGDKITSALNSKGLTFLINYGEEQKVKHFHLHLLPDYNSDTVFKTKRSIEENYNLVKKC